MPIAALITTAASAVVGRSWSRPGGREQDRHERAAPTRPRPASSPGRLRDRRARGARADGKPREEAARDVREAQADSARVGIDANLRAAGEGRTACSCRANDTTAITDGDEQLAGTRRGRARATELGTANAGGHRTRLELRAESPQLAPRTGSSSPPSMLARPPSPAGRRRFASDPNRRADRPGLANIRRFFRGFPVRRERLGARPVAQAAGAKTQVAGLVGAAALVAILLAAPGPAPRSPDTACGGRDQRGHRHVRSPRAPPVLPGPPLGLLPLDDRFAASLLGVIPGIAVAVGMSILELRGAARGRPHDAILGPPEGREGYHDITRYPAAKQIPGWCVPLGDAPRSSRTRGRVPHALLDAVAAAGPEGHVDRRPPEPIRDVDSTAAESSR